jgi:peptidoglycan/LPS O-acetylase OafA/YrhL
MYMQMNWVAEHGDAPLWQHIAVAAGVLFLSILLARCVFKAYDLPVRAWLTEHWLKRRK